MVKRNQAEVTKWGWNIKDGINGQQMTAHTICMSASQTGLWPGRRGWTVAWTPAGSISGSPFVKRRNST